MSKSDPIVPRKWTGLNVHLRGHLLLFDQRPSPLFDVTTGARLLLIAVGVEILRLVTVRWGYPALPLVVLVLFLLVCALLLVRLAAGLKLSQIGLYRWREWQAVEKSYFIQLLVIANVVFPLVFASRLRLLFQSSGASAFWNIFVPYLFFGFYQEVIYRGLLQSELIRRWGAFIGILIANVLYTFGPLHWSYFSARASLAVPMFASIFAIGLFFGVLFRRSGNLWIVAVIHGIGNAYIVASLSPAR